VTQGPNQSVGFTPPSNSFNVGNLKIMVTREKVMRRMTATALRIGGRFDMTEGGWMRKGECFVKKR
jgi:hypothetical protein